MNHNLQRLRALAALAVLAFHGGEFYVQNGGQLGALRAVIASGHAGVDLFFVISGFIIARGAGALPLTASQARRFIERRLLRIYLGYWPVAALALAFYHSIGTPRLAAVDPWASALLLGERIDRLLVGPAWSLAYELFFYASFAFLAILPRRIARAATWLYLALVLAANLLDPRNAYYFLLSPHFLELFAGMVLGQTACSVATRTKRWGLGLVAAAVVLGWIWSGNPQPLVKVLCVGSASLIAVYLADQAAGQGYNPRGALSAVGDASYGLYLLHYLLLEVFQFWLAPSLASASLRLAVFGCWIAGIIAVSLLHYRWLERPLYRWACQKRGLGRGAAAAPA